MNVVKKPLQRLYSGSGGRLLEEQRVAAAEGMGGDRESLPDSGQESGTQERAGQQAGSNDPAFGPRIERRQEDRRKKQIPMLLDTRTTPSRRTSSDVVIDVKC